MDTITAICAAFFYSLALAFIIPNLINTGKLFNAGEIKSNTVIIFIIFALLSHGLNLKVLIFATSGQNLSIVNVASIISFLSSLIVTISILRYRAWFVLPIVYSISVIILLATPLFPDIYISHSEGNPSLLIHITLSLFAYSILMIATFYAIQLAWLDNKLHSKKRVKLNPNIPPLMVIERQLFNIIVIGLILLTLSLITGFAYMDDMFAQGKTHKTILSMFAWSVYCMLIWGHFSYGWRGKKALWFNLLASFILTLGYFGSRFVQEIILS